MKRYRSKANERYMHGIGRVVHVGSRILHGISEGAVLAGTVLLQLWLSQFLFLVAFVCLVVFLDCAIFICKCLVAPASSYTEKKKGWLKKARS